MTLAAYLLLLLLRCHSHLFFCAIIIRKVPNELNDMVKRSRHGTPLVRSHDFHCLESGHPYGVLPWGNRFLPGAAPPVAVGTPLLRDDDECWNHILTFLDGTSLARMAQVNRYFYVAGHSPELWRDLVLRRLEYSNTKKDNDSNTIHVMEQSWKDTYARLFCANGAAYRTPHVPMAVPGVYSDFWYRLHSCRAFGIPDAWYHPSSSNNDNDSDPCALDCVSHETMNAERFFVEYEQPNKPVILQGAAKSWPAFTKWNDASYCRQQTKGRNFRATSGVAPLPAQFSLEAYFQYSAMPWLEEAPVYLFDRNALVPHSPLWNDFHPALCQTCPFWDPATPQHDLFQYLGEGRRPDHTWWIVGPRRSGSVFHIDPNATHAWNAAVVGRKRWIFYPPGVTPPGVHPSADGDSVALPLSVGEWLLTFWEEHLQRQATAPPHERPLEGTAFPGDVLFVPHGWWHMVINLDDVNMAITHNYVAQSNLSSVLKFLSEKRDQVSGCRDRAEAIQPEHLYEEFVAGLNDKHPAWLQEALNEPDWTCAAWSRSSGAPEEDNNTKENQQSSSSSPSSCGVSIMSKAKTEESTSFSFSFL